jgi:guanylate cyclase
MLLAGGVGLSTNMLLLASFGLTRSAWEYAFFATLLFLAGLTILAFPSSYDVVIRSFLLSAVAINLVIQFSFGGYSSGFYALPWAILGPLGAVLFIGRRFTLATMAAFSLSLLAMMFLEPLAITNAPQVDTQALLSVNTFSLFGLGLMSTLASLYLLGQEERYRARANDLLLNMLPGSIATRLKDSSDTIADAYDDVTVLFADMAGSMPLFARMEPAEAVDWLNEVFSMFDSLVDKYGLEKIRTIGDNYMVASGVPVPREDHARAMAHLALDMLQGVEQIPARHGKRMAFRLGINSGPLVAGVIGESKYQYDLWGDTVNMASRMESHGEVGRVHISAATYELIKDEFECVSRNRIEIKGIGEMETWFLVASKAA